MRPGRSLGPGFLAITLQGGWEGSQVASLSGDQALPALPPRWPRNGCAIFNHEPFVNLLPHHRTFGGLWGAALPPHPSQSQAQPPCVVLRFCH